MPRKKRQAKAEKRGLPDTQLSNPLGLAPSNGTDNADKAKEPLCTACGNPEDYQDHFKPSPHYHPFASSAPSAKRKSSTKSAAVSSIPNSETQKEDALVATLAAP